MRLEAERQTLGCLTATCAIELADAYGARWVVFSRIARVSTSWTLSLSLFDSQKATIVGRGLARAKTLPAVHDVLPDAVVDMMTTLGPPTRPVRVAAAPTTTPENRAQAASPASADPHTAPFLSVDDVALADEPLGPPQTAGCRYVDDADAWRCGEGRAAAGVDVVVARTGSLTTAGVVNFAAELVDDCVAAVDVEIVAGEEPVRVDWRTAAATVDGVVVEVRRRGSGEAVVVPPRARARERLSAATGCLGARSVGPAGEVVTLDVAYAIGAAPARALWVRQRVHAQVPEDELLVLVPRPEIPAAAAGTDDEPPWPVWTWAGVGAGLSVGAAAGSLVGVARMPASSSAGDRALVGSGWGAVAAVVVGVPAALVGIVVDGTQYALWSQAHEANVAAARALRARRAWERIPRADVGGLGVSTVGAIE